MLHHSCSPRFHHCCTPPSPNAPPSLHIPCSLAASALPSLFKVSTCKQIKPHNHNLIMFALLLQVLMLSATTHSPLQLFCFDQSSEAMIFSRASPLPWQPNLQPRLRLFLTPISISISSVFLQLIKHSFSNHLYFSFAGLEAAVLTFLAQAVFFKPPPCSSPYQPPSPLQSPPAFNPVMAPSLLFPDF